MQKSYNKDEIDFFLQMGYFPNFYLENNTLKNAISDQNPPPHSTLTGVNADKNTLLQTGADLFRQGIHNDFDTIQRNVIPLSGGMDSRAILAVALEKTDAKNIETYTFGTPGTWDFEIGNKIAHDIGTNHRVINLNETTWSKDSLEKTAALQNHQTFLFHNIPHEIQERYKDSVIWSGYIGDLITGGHLKSNASSTLEAAKNLYLSKRTEVKSTKLHTSSNQNFIDFIGHDRTLITKNNDTAYDLTWDEIVMMHEVKNVTAPHVLPHGYDCKTPFINNDFMWFFLSLESKYRYKQTLFIEMLEKNWPALFNIKSKYYHGFSPHTPRVFINAQRLYNGALGQAHARLKYKFLPPHPGLNYFDFDKKLRHDTAFQELIKSYMDKFTKRDLVDPDLIDTLWNNHLNAKSNHSDAFQIMMSLEINLAQSAH